MRKVVCKCCKSEGTIYLSEKVNGLLLCRACIRTALDWLYTNHLVDGNPLAWDLVTAIGDYVGNDKYRFWIPSKYESSAWSEAFVSLDSEKKPKELLDLL